jgi:hypothetical protein
MKLKILRINVENRKGKDIHKPNDLVIDASELEAYRKSLKESDTDTVLFNFEELGDKELEKD